MSSVKRLLTNVLFFTMLALAAWLVVGVIYPAYWGLIGWAEQSSLKFLASGFVWLFSPLLVAFTVALLVALAFPHIAYGLSALSPLLAPVFAGVYTLLFFFPALILLLMAGVYLFI